MNLSADLSPAAAELAKIIAEKIETGQWIQVQAIAEQWDYVRFPYNELEAAIDELVLHEHLEHRKTLDTFEVLIRNW